MISEDFIVNIIYQNAKRVKFNKSQNLYNFECPICNEGKSSGIKRRGFYLLDTGVFSCHNCQRSWGAVKWVQTVTNYTYHEIIKLSNEYEYIPHENDEMSFSKKKTTHTLPFDSINLSDELQLNYHKDEKYLKLSLDYIHTRRLDTAINKPKTYYISFKDFTHKNRLIIPFYDVNNKVIFYQTRTLDKSDDGQKYLSKTGADFSLFGINKIIDGYKNIFMFEGPIDSMFVPNGVAMGGLSLKDNQLNQLRHFPFHDKIWVLDNQFDNCEVVARYNKLIESDEKIFFMPEKLSKFKDLNELCCNAKIDTISPKFIENNTFRGIRAKLELSKRT